MPAPDLDYLLNVCTLSPLLTAEQEIMYGKRIQAGIALTNPTSEQYVAKPNATAKARYPVRAKGREGNGQRQPALSDQLRQKVCGLLPPATFGLW